MLMALSRSLSLHWKQSNSCSNTGSNDMLEFRAIPIAPLISLSHAESCRRSAQQGPFYVIFHVGNLGNRGFGAKIVLKCISSPSLRMKENMLKSASLRIFPRKPVISAMQQRWFFEASAQKRGCMTISRKQDRNTSHLREKKACIEHALTFHVMCKFRGTANTEMFFVVLT